LEEKNLRIRRDIWVEEAWSSATIENSPQAMHRPSWSGITKGS